MPPSMPPSILQRVMKTKMCLVMVLNNPGETGTGFGIDCLVGNEFTQNTAAVFMQRRQMYRKVIGIIRVGDLIAADNKRVWRDVEETLAEDLKMKDRGTLKHFVGIDFNQSDGSVTTCSGLQ